MLSKSIRKVHRLKGSSYVALSLSDTKDTIQKLIDKVENTFLLSEIGN